MQTAGGSPPFGLSALDEELLRLSLPLELTRFFPGGTSTGGSTTAWQSGTPGPEPGDAVATSPPAQGQGGLSAAAETKQGVITADDAQSPGRVAAKTASVGPAGDRLARSPGASALSGAAMGAPSFSVKDISLRGDFVPFDPALAGAHFDPIAYLNENLTEDNLDVLIQRLGSEIDRANESLGDLILEADLPSLPTDASGGAARSEDPEDPRPMAGATEILAADAAEDSSGSAIRQKMETVVQDILSAEQRAEELISELDVINNARMCIEGAGFSLQVAAKFVSLSEKLSSDLEALQLGYEDFTPALTQMFILSGELEDFSSVPEIAAAMKKYTQVKVAVKELEKGILERSVRSDSPDPEAKRPKASGPTELAPMTPPVVGTSRPVGEAPPIPTPENIDTYKLWSHITVLTAYNAALGTCSEFYDRLVRVLIEFFFGISQEGMLVHPPSDAGKSVGAAAPAKRPSYKDIEDLYKRFVAFLRAAKEYLIALERHVSALTAKGKDALQAYFAQFKFSLFDPTACFSKAAIRVYLYPALVEHFFDALGKALGDLVSKTNESSVPAALSCLLTTLDFEARVFDPELAGLDLSHYVERRPSSLFSPVVPLILQVESRVMRQTCAQAASEYDPREFLSRYEAGGSSDIGLSRSAMKVLGALRGFLRNTSRIARGTSLVHAIEAVSDAVVAYCGSLTGQLSLPAAVPPIVQKYFGRASPQARSYELVSILEGTRKAPYSISLFSSQTMLFVHLTSDALCGLLTLLILATTLKDDFSTLCSDIQTQAPEEFREPISAAVERAVQSIQKLKIYSLLTISAALSGDFVIRGVLPTLDPERVASLSDEKKKVKGNPLSIAADIFMNHIRKCYAAAFRASASGYARGEAGDNIVTSLTNFVGSMIVTIPASVEKVKAVEGTTLTLMDGVYAAFQCAPLNRISQDILGRLQARLKNTVAYLLMLDGIGIENASLESFQVLFENSPVEDCQNWLNDIVRYRTHGSDRGREGRDAGEREGRFRDILANLVDAREAKASGPAAKSERAEREGEEKRARKEPRERK